MEQRFYSRAPYFPGEHRERGNPAAVFANFDRSSCGEFAQTCFELVGEFHAVIIIDVLTYAAI